MGRTEISPGVWKLRAELGRDERGRYPQKTVRFRGTEKQAARAEAALQARADAGEFDRPTTSAPGTVAELLDLWLAAPRRRPWAPATTRKNTAMVRDHLKPAFGRLRLEEITSLKIENAYQRWSRAGVGDPTIRRAHACLRAALGYAARHRMIHDNPASRAEVVDQPKRRPTKVTVDQVRTVIELALTGAPRRPDARPPLPAIRPDERMATIIRMAFVTGARRSELAALRWCDVDLDAGTVTITAALDTATAGRPRKATKTADEGRVALAIDAGAVEALRAWHRSCAESALKLGWSLTATTPVWRARDDGTAPIHPDTITKAWRKLADRAGLPDQPHFHDIRHAAATHLVGDGFDPVTVADRLGHAQRSTTLEMYAGGLTANDRRAADHLGQLLG